MLGDRQTRIGRFDPDLGEISSRHNIYEPWNNRPHPKVQNELSRRQNKVYQNSMLNQLKRVLLFTPYVLARLVTNRLASFRRSLSLCTKNANTALLFFNFLFCFAFLVLFLPPLPPPPGENNESSQEQPLVAEEEEEGMQTAAAVAN